MTTGTHTVVGSRGMTAKGNGKENTQQMLPFLRRTEESHSTT
jgi:hypothetical protein